MKKLFSILIIAISFLATNAIAQSTVPRFGITPNADNTYRTLTNGYASITTTTATAVLVQRPRHFNTIYKIGTLTHALTDSMYVTDAFVGDQVTIIFSADTLTAGRVVTFGNHISSAGTLTVPNSKSGHSGEATVVFTFDGIRWTEKSRTITTN